MTYKMCKFPITFLSGFDTSGITDTNGLTISNTLTVRHVTETRVDKRQ